MDIHTRPDASAGAKRLVWTVEPLRIIVVRRTEPVGSSYQGNRMDSNAIPVEKTSTADERVRRWSWKKFWLSFFIFLVVAVLGVFAYMAYDDHYVQRGHFFLGTKVAGIDVSRRTQAWATQQVEQQIATPLLAPLTVSYGKRRWTLETSKIASVDVKGMVKDAYQAGWKQGMFERLYKRWMREPMGVDVPVRFAFERQKVGTFVNKLMKQINRKPVDARQFVVGHKVKTSSSRVGYELYRKDASKRIAAALPAGTRRLKLSVAVLPPRLTKKDFKHALFVNLSDNMLYFYTYDKITQSYGVATGQGGFPTPTGNWKIVDKVANPTWHNPHMAWSAGMPESIPPGPGNPLGTRALYLNANGIRIHGTYNDGSIGSHASHGCIRMHIWDSEDLFPRVDLGTPVYIRW